MFNVWVSKNFTFHTRIGTSNIATNMWIGLNSTWNSDAPYVYLYHKNSTELVGETRDPDYYTSGASSSNHHTFINGTSPITQGTTQSIKIIITNGHVYYEVFGTRYDTEYVLSDEQIEQGVYVTITCSPGLAWNMGNTYFTDD